jgi:hypothetical protein
MKSIFIEKNTNLRKAFELYYNSIIKKRLIPFSDVSVENFSQECIVFLTEPCMVNNELYTIYPIWFEYLKQSPCPFRIIVVNYCGIDNFDSNPFAINIMDDTRYVSDKIKLICSANDLAFRNIIIPKQAFHIVNKLKTFFSGHDEESLIKVLNIIDQSFYNGPVTVAKDYYTVEECIKEFIEKCSRPEWKRFKDRYDRYRPYFQCMPFYHQVKEIEKYINDVDKYLANIPTAKKEFIDMDISISVKSIRKILEEIDNAYIKSEQT